MTRSNEVPTRESYSYWTRLNTRWADNDCYGHINNSVYYTYIDTVVNNYLIEKGGLVPSESPLIGVVVESSCRFRNSLSYPQSIDAGMRVLKLGNSSVQYEVGMFGPEDDEISAWGGFVHVFVDRRDRSPVTIPADIRSALRDIFRSESQ